MGGFIGGLLRDGVGCLVGRLVGGLLGALVGRGVGFLVRRGVRGGKVSEEKVLKICGLSVGIRVGGQRGGSTTNTNFSDLKFRQFSPKSIKPLSSVYVEKIERGTILLEPIVSKLAFRDKNDNDVSALILLGIVFLNRLSASVKNFKLRKLPINSGSVPDSPLDLRLMETTRAKLGDPVMLPQVMPSKEHQLGCKVKRLRRTGSSGNFPLPLKRSTCSLELGFTFPAQILLEELHTLLPGDRSED